MRATRLVVALLLVGTGALPYAAPLVCSGLADMPAMTHDDMDGGDRQAPTAWADAQGVPQCDFSACSVAPAAPPMTVTTMAIDLGTAQPAVAVPSVHAGPAVAPLTPPPLS